MTKAQKENQARFKAAQVEAKKLKAKNPKLAHTEAVKQAFAKLFPKGSKAKAPAKKKIGSVNDSAIERMDGLVKLTDLKNIRNASYSIVDELTYEGFDIKEVKQYLKIRFELILREF